MKLRRRILAVLLALTLLAGTLAACAKPAADPAPTPAQAETPQPEAAKPATPPPADSDTYLFTDSAGRQVELPKSITRVAPSGSYAQMMTYAIAPEKLMGLSSKLDGKQSPYMLDSVKALPVFGQFYGQNVTTNYEAIISAAPDVIIDMGDVKDTVVEDMDRIQAQTGIPTIFIEANLATMAQAWETLGQVLGQAETGKAMADYTTEVLTMARENAAQIPEDQRVRVLFTMGDTGLEVVGRSSIHSEVIEVVGAVNAAEQDALSSSGNDTVSMEQVLNWQPDAILLSPDSIYDTIGADTLWADVTAVQNGRFYEIPGEPYNWLSRPPSIQRLLGILWLGNLLYPQQYDYDMVEKAQEFYKLFYHYELSAQQAETLLSRSTGKGA